MIEALSTSVMGIRNGLSKLDEVAASIAGRSVDSVTRPDGTTAASDTGGGLATDIVQAIIAKHSVSANAAMFRRADSTLGELVDLLG